MIFADHMTYLLINQKFQCIKGTQKDDTLN